MDTSFFSCYVDISSFSFFVFSFISNNNNDDDNVNVIYCTVLYVMYVRYDTYRQTI